MYFSKVIEVESMNCYSAIVFLSIVHNRVIFVDHPGAVPCDITDY